MQVGLDYTLLIQMVQFLIIVFVVNKLIIKPITETFTSRDNKVNGINDRVHKNLEEIENKKIEYEAKLQSVRAEISEYSNRLRTDATARVQAIVGKAKDETQAELEASRLELEKESRIIRETLKHELSGLTEQIVATVTKH